RSCDLMPNGKSVLFFHDKGSGAGALALTAGLEDEMVAKFNDHYHKVNPWVDHAMRRPLGKVMQADEMLPREALKGTEYFQDYLRPQDIETGLGVTLHRDARLHVFFSIISADVGKEQLEHARRTIGLLVPHLNRAFRIGCRGAAGDRGMQPPPGSRLQVDAKLRVVAADPEALALLAQTEALSIGALGRLVCKDADLLSCLQHLLTTDAFPAVRHRHLKRKSGGLPLHVCLYRPGHTGSASAGTASCFLQLEDPARALPDGVRRFCAMHGLTSAEAGVVALLVAGHTPGQIAAQRKTAQATVRTQLKSIFWKTGCNRQADIIRQAAIMAQDHGLPYVTPIIIPDPRD
ncbi:hypothetical protein, partial [Paracoccus sp. (in: a-proteobacteria)]|uniref:helix-turn-helix transcriptional regulator n=1 Tax=Paracoccus sp. TaxID=267 RepID=UPI0026DF1957